MMKNFTIVLCFLLFFSHNSSLVAEAPSMVKGYFGESLIDDIWVATGRHSISDKLNPVLHGPDRIYRLPSGGIELHEVKAYSSWAGKKAMETTVAGKPTYELSQAWCQNWLNNTLADPFATKTEKVVAKTVQEAITSNKCSYVFDEINLITKQVRFSKVIHVGKNDVTLSQLAGPSRIQNFESLFSQKTHDLENLRVGKLDKIMKAPKVWNNAHPLTHLEKEQLIQRFGQQDIAAKSGFITPDGRLLVSVKAGAATGFLVFAGDSSAALLQYSHGDILKPELLEKIHDAALRGGFVGTCVGVTVFLGAIPGGWCVFAVSIGSYIVVDKSVAVWREHRYHKFVTLDDLKGWGITSDTTLDLHDSVLELQQDSTLKVDDSILSF